MGSFSLMARRHMDLEWLGGHDMSLGPNFEGTAYYLVNEYQLPLAH